MFGLIAAENEPNVNKPAPCMSGSLTGAPK